MRRVPSARLTALSASCDVIPAGLSSSSSPSISRASAGAIRPSCVMRHAPPSPTYRVRHLDSRLLGLQRACNLLGAIRLDDIADLEVVEVLDSNTALVALLHFAHVVLEAAKRSDCAVVDF